MPRKTRGKTSAPIVRAARQQRRQPTLAEDKLWEALRGRRLAGLKFRRQHPYGRFVLDYFCVKHQLAIELDGGIHAEPTQAARDAERTEFLRAHGIRVMRFRNDQVENEIETVLKQIEQEILTPQPPSPELCSGEGGAGGEVTRASRAGCRADGILAGARHPRDEIQKRPSGERD